MQLSRHTKDPLPFPPALFKGNQGQAQALNSSILHLRLSKTTWISAGSVPRAELGAGRASRGLIPLLSSGNYRLIIPD